MTHALGAIGHRLVESGRSVIFAPAYRLVQDLPAAKRDLALPRQLRKHRRGPTTQPREELNRQN